MGFLIGCYDRLLRSYGPQGWWPLSGRDRTGNAEARSELEPKHHNGMPMDDRDRFEIGVGAILTQNTNWLNVEKAIANLNKDGLLCVRGLLEVDEAKLASIIRPAGYHNQKAKKLKAFAGFFSCDVPERDDLLGVWGIGPETADSILLYAFGVRVFVVDAYTRRIFSRIGVIGKDWNYEKIRCFFEEGLEGMGVDVFQEFHALIVAHAKACCGVRPVCDGCMLCGLCKRIM